jgi:AraC-like DNA-binding protein
MSLAPIATPRSAEHVTGMVRVAPAADLSDLVEQHWIVTWDRRGCPPLRQEVLPDPCVNLSVEPAGRLLYGVGSGHSKHELAGRAMVIGTKFRPGGFSGFRREPVSALRGRVLTLPEAFGPEGETLDHVLAAAGDVSAVIAAVTAFLRVRRPAPDPQRTLTMRIVEAIRVAEVGTSVSDLAAEFALSPRTLQRLFADHVGTSPKQVLQRFRRQQAADLLTYENDVSLARIAAEMGYFDQAHLARDFRTKLGRSPSAVQRASAQGA